MKKTSPKLPLLFIGLVALSSCNKDFNSSSPSVETVQNSKFVHSGSPGEQLISDQYIVTLTDEFASGLLASVSGYDQRNEVLYAEIKSLLTKVGLEKMAIGGVYNTAMKGFSIQIPADKLGQLAALPQVKNIEQDEVVRIAGFPDKSTNEGSYKTQTVSYGCTRVGSGSGAGKRAWVLDTGIDLDHPDLNVNTSLSRSFTGLEGTGYFGTLPLLGSPSPSPDDQHGHGTHCAGIIAAKDNTIGNKGVAYGAEVVAVQVLLANGSGSITTVLQGVDYVAAFGKAGEVANMSLAGGANSALDLAVQAAALGGVAFTLAAGNDNRHADNASPARANGTNLYTISSIDSQNKLSGFSNYGNPPVDYAEPGSGIYSCYKNGGYATMSGTSMAAPHAAGIILLHNGGSPNNGGYALNDKDATPDIIGVK